MASTCIFDAGRLGVIEGRVAFTEHGVPAVRYVGGLPYALPPVGQYRFRKPRPLPSDHQYGTRAHPGIYVGKTAVCPQPSAEERAEELWDEDCLRLNLYVPTGEAPESGWPVYFWIHGGFLQWGHPNTDPDDLVALYSQTVWDAVIVMPAYRVNVFGFLSGHALAEEARIHGEPFANMGFWDQRLALEWTADHVRSFGGDPKRITIAGFSAGGYSTFQQLAYDLYHDTGEQGGLLKQAVIISNSPGVQPKGVGDQQELFEKVLTALNIPIDASFEDQLSRLRAASVHELIAIQEENEWSGFRATTDGQFIQEDIFDKIRSGDFARKMKRRGIRLLSGECRDEHTLYRLWRTPESDYQSVRERLYADYPTAAVDKLCQFYCGEDHRLPKYAEDWQDMFGRLFSSMQVHGLYRGFNNALSKQGLVVNEDLFRYRMEWRPSSVRYPREWGVTHGTDLSIWFFSNLNDAEKEIARPWNTAISSFVRGESMEWGTKKIVECRRLNAEGQTDIWDDERWDEGVHLWNLLNGEPENPLSAVAHL